MPYDHDNHPSLELVISIAEFPVMMLFATKSKVSASFTRRTEPAIRSFFSHGRATVGKMATTTKTYHTTRPTLPLSVRFKYDNGRYNTTPTRVKLGRNSLENPFIMAFLARRNKSSCAAIDHEVVGSGIGGNNGTAKVGSHAGVDGRCYQEAWMVNLGRGDDAWLSGPRNADWYTGLHPTVCPGKYEI